MIACTTSPALCWQVLNDLLDPARANLKLREDPAKGFFVENLKEETLVSVDHALSVITAGDAHRKVQINTFSLTVQDVNVNITMKLVRLGRESVSCLMCCVRSPVLERFSPALNCLLKQE